jgi:hypothetical protein
MCIVYSIVGKDTFQFQTAKDNENKIRIVFIFVRNIFKYRIMGSVYLLILDKPTE